MRESAFRVFAGSSMLVMDLQTDAVLRVLRGGLEDAESIDVGPCLFLYMYLLKSVDVGVNDRFVWPLCAHRRRFCLHPIHIN
jgi:hypothetical protein